MLLVIIAARQCAAANQKRRTLVDAVINSKDHIHDQTLEHETCFDGCDQNNPCGPPLHIDDVYYYKHCDSSKFIQCTDHGQCYINYCAVGLVWDQDLLQCIFELTSRSSTDPPVATIPPSSCGMSSEDRENEIKTAIETVSDPSTLYHQGTPQNKALQWILHQDGFQTCPQDTNLVQRYTLAVFYHSTGGGMWNECNAPNDFIDFQDLLQANSDCSLIANGADPYQVPTFSSSDAWLTPSHECLWGGVACAGATTAVDRIQFENNALSGTLPSELSNLNELRYLIIEEGQTGGPIPSELGLLSGLIVLDLNFNVLQGTIPEEIYTGLHLLFQLDLNDNLLTGTISPAVSNLSYLDFLQLENNNIDGTIPESLGSLIGLRVLELYNNNLISTMPDSVCQNVGRGLTKLTADCDESSSSRVYCPCCTACPI